MKRQAITLLLPALMSIFFSCKLDLISFDAPDIAETGQVITVTVSGNAQDIGENAGMHGLVLQIPLDWQVISNSTDLAFISLSENSELASLYTPEPSYKVWAAGSSQTGEGGRSVTVTLKILTGNFEGAQGETRGYTLKAVAAVKRMGFWITDDPPNQFDFSDITQEPYIETIAVSKVEDRTAPAPVTTLYATDQYAGSEVLLRWEGYDEGTQGDVASYHVYRDTSPFTSVVGMTPIRTVPFGRFEYTESGLAAGNTYYFAVTAVDEVLNENRTVSWVSITPTVGGTVSGALFHRESSLLLTEQSISVALVQGDPCAQSYDIKQTVSSDESDGTFAITGIAPGEYFLRVGATLFDLSNYTTSWWTGGDSFSSNDCMDAVPITVAGSEIITGKNFKLSESWIYEEHFESTDPSHVKFGTDGPWLVSNGRYHHNDPSGTSQTLSSSYFKSGIVLHPYQGSVKVSASYEGGDLNYAYGLWIYFVRFTDDQWQIFDDVRVLITSRSYKVDRRSGGEYSYYVNWTAPPWMTGNNDVIKVEKAGNVFDFYINDHAVLSTPIENSAHLAIGLFSSSIVRASFDDFRLEYLQDIDGDGIPDHEDAFPNDPTEWKDTDRDGIGDNADTDDDNDGMPGEWETQYGLNPLVYDADGDLDSDGFANLQEYLAGTIPNDLLSKPETMPEMMPADVNGDRTLNLIDAILSLQAASSSNPASSPIWCENPDLEGTLRFEEKISCLSLSALSAKKLTLNGDLNGDNKIGAEEALYALQTISGLRANPVFLSEIGMFPGVCIYDVSAQETVVMRVNISNSRGVNPSDIPMEWLFAGVKIGSAMAGAIRGNESVTPLSEINDPALVTFDFDHAAGNTHTFGTLRIPALALAPGDMVMFGYAWTASDPGHVIMDNIIILNIH